MKKSFFALVAATSFMVVAFADTILRPPTVEWDAITVYSDGKNLETNAVLKYNVYRAVTTTNTWVQIATTTNLFYADTNAVLAQTYYYKIAAELWGLEATPSVAISFATYAPEQLLTAPRLRE